MQLARLTYGDASGTPLIIAHGLFGSARNWNVIAQRLSDTRQVISVDMRNHGQSFWAAPHSYEAMANDLAEVIVDLGRPVDLLGHSMGGKASMALALARPNLLRRLIVADIAPVRYAHDQLQNIDAMQSLDLNHINRRSEAQNALASAGITDPTLQAFFTQSLDLKAKQWAFNLAQLRKDMDLILNFPEFGGHFNQLTLFLTGANSTYVTRDMRPTIREKFRKARFVTLNKASHWLHAEQPRAFEHAVRTFLDHP